MPLLIVEHHGTRRMAPMARRILIGRRSGNHVVVNDRSVAMIHAWIDKRGEECVLTDTGSRTGTLVNGKRIARPLPLVDGDVITVGPATLTFHSNGEEEQPRQPSAFATPAAAAISAAHVPAPALPAEPLPAPVSSIAVEDLPLPSTVPVAAPIPPAAIPIPVAPTPPPPSPVLQRVESSADGWLFDCACGAPLWAGASFAGRTAYCRYCGREVRVPDSAAAAAATVLEDEQQADVLFPAPAEPPQPIAGVKQPTVTEPEAAAEPVLTADSPNTSVDAAPETVVEHSHEAEPESRPFIADEGPAPAPQAHEAPTEIVVPPVVEVTSELAQADAAPVVVEPELTTPAEAPVQPGQDETAHVASPVVTTPEPHSEAAPSEVAPAEVADESPVISSDADRPTVIDVPTSAQVQPAVPWDVTEPVEEVAESKPQPIDPPLIDPDIAEFLEKMARAAKGEEEPVNTPVVDPPPFVADVESVFIPFATTDAPVTLAETSASTPSEETPIHASAEPAAESARTTELPDIPAHTPPQEEPASIVETALTSETIAEPEPTPAPSEPAGLVATDEPAHTTQPAPEPQAVTEPAPVVEHSPIAAPAPLDAPPPPPEPVAAPAPLIEEKPLAPPAPLFAEAIRQPDVAVVAAPEPVVPMAAQSKAVAPSPPPTPRGRAVPPPPAKPGKFAPLKASRTCGICQSGILFSEKTTTCPSCGLTFHAECWIENRGCSAYGCPQVGVLDAKTSGAAGSPDGDEADQDATVAAQAAEVEREAAKAYAVKAPFPWEFATLACSAVCLLLSALTFGVPSLIVGAGTMVYLSRKPGVRRKTGILLFSTFLALVGFVGGAMASWFFWFGSGGGSRP